MNIIDTEIGLRLKIARQSTGYKTALEFSQKFNIPKSTYAQHESGKRSLTPQLIFKYSQLCEVSPSWMLTGMGHPAPNCHNKKEKKNFIDTEVQKLQAMNKLPLQQYTTIDRKDTACIIDLKLLSQIQASAFNILVTKKLAIKSDDIIEFSIDVYNQIIQLHLNEDDRDRIIELSVNSLSKGNEIIQIQKNKLA